MINRRSTNSSRLDQFSPDTSISKHFFVVGCSRSGTTLLSVLLDRHTRLSVPPETAFFDEIAPWLPCSDEHLLEILHGWRRLSELGLEPRMVLHRLGCGRSTSSDVLATILGLYAQTEGKVRCGEKTPQHLIHVPTILQQFPGAKIICMLRDGRDVALSLNAMPWWTQGLAAAADFWKRSVYLAEKFSRQYPTQFMILRYEDLVTNPAQVLPSVMDYLGEQFESGQIHPDVLSHVVLPRSMEWKGRALQLIEANRIGWRRHETPAQEIAFLEHTLHEELCSHGYQSGEKVDNH